MSKTIGIDLGTTNSCMAFFESGEAEVIENSEGARTTPSVVSFREDERVVGAVAYRQAVTNPENTVSSVKRFMGRKYSEVSEEETIVPYRVVAGENDDVLIEAGGKKLAPPEISAMILQKLKADAEAKLGETVDSAIITVPAYFNDDQRQATKDAGRIAGLKVERIINEPTAAALAYGLNKGDSEEKILVFDLGGGTFDVSLLEIADGVFEVMATSGDNHLGGDNWDAAIVEYLAKEFKKDQGVDLREDKNALQRLYEAAEKAKIELSSAADTQISLPFVTAVEGQPKHLEMRLSRAKFNELTADLLQRVVDPVNRAIEDAGKPTIDHVVLVGGMTRMPAVREKVKELTGSDPHQGVNPDEVVAMGAAIQAGVLAGDVGDILLLDVTPLTLGLETKGHVMTPLINRNTTIPTNRTEIFSTAEDNQNSVEVHVIQGERALSTDNKSLGRFELTGIAPAARGIPQIEVTFDINVDGLLTVSAKDLSTGTEQQLQVKGGSGLSDEEIEKMVVDAEAHAADDKVRKNLAVAINAAESILYASEAIFAEAKENEEAPGVAEALSKAGEKKVELESAVESARTAERIDDMKTWVASLNALHSEYQSINNEITDLIYNHAAEAARKSAASEDVSDAEVVEDSDEEIIDAEVVEEDDDVK